MPEIYLALDRITHPESQDTSPKSQEPKSTLNSLLEFEACSTRGGWVLWKQKIIPFSEIKILFLADCQFHRLYDLSFPCSFLI
jgi:hypothetical protein